MKLPYVRNLDNICSFKDETFVYRVDSICDKNRLRRSLMSERIREIFDNMAIKRNAKIDLEEFILRDINFGHFTPFICVPLFDRLYIFLCFK